VSVCVGTDLMNKKLAGKAASPNSKVTDNRVLTSIGEHPQVALVGTRKLRRVIREPIRWKKAVAPPVCCR